MSYIYRSQPKATICYRCLSLIRGCKKNICIFLYIQLGHGKQLPFHLLRFHGNVVCHGCTIVFVVFSWKLQITPEIPKKKRGIFINSNSSKHTLARISKHLSRLYCVGMSDWSYIVWDDTNICTRQCIYVDGYVVVVLLRSAANDILKDHNSIFNFNTIRQLSSANVEYSFLSSIWK